jgi:Protein of unknown function (DUF3263)
MTPPSRRTASDPAVPRPRTALDDPAVEAARVDAEPFEDELDSDAEAAPVTSPAEESVGSLSERERQILDFERQWWRHAGAKEQAIRDRFALSSTRYYQAVNALLDNPAALAYDPVLVRRLRRLRATRARARTGGRRTA